MNNVKDIDIKSKVKTTIILLLILVLMIPMLSALKINKIGDIEITSISYAAGSKGGGGTSGGGGAGRSYGEFFNTEKLLNKELKSPHVFSKSHTNVKTSKGNKGTLSLGSGQNTVSNKRSIFKKFENVVTYAAKVLGKANGSYQIVAAINGITTTIRYFVSGGTVLSINAFIGTSSKIIGKYAQIKGKW